MTGLRVAVVQHEPATGLGAFAGLLEDAGVEADVVRAWRDPLPDPSGLDGVIVLGGSGSASDPGLAAERRWIHAVATAETPYLGICLGAQLLAAALGARVVRGRRPEIGIRDVVLTDASRRDPLFGCLSGPLRVFDWHGDFFTLPRGAVPLARSIGGRCHAYRWGAYAYGLQFHPEATLREVAAWPWNPGYLDQLQTAGVDAGAVLGELAGEEAGLHELARLLLGRWLVVCAGAAGIRSAWAAASVSLSA